MHQCPGIFSLPTQYPSQLRPLLYGTPEVTHYCRPVFVLFRENFPQVLEGVDLGEGYSIEIELPLRPHPCLLLRQATPFPLHYPLAKVRLKVPAVKDILGHKHVALGAPGAGSVTLLQDHNCILHVAMCKVNPEVGPTGRPTQAPLSVLCMNIYVWKN